MFEEGPEYFKRDISNIKPGDLFYLNPKIYHYLLGNKTMVTELGPKFTEEELCTTPLMYIKTSKSKRSTTASIHALYLDKLVQLQFFKKNLVNIYDCMLLIRNVKE